MASDGDDGTARADRGAGTRAVYARHAAGYDARRSKALFEARWLERFSPGAAGDRAGSGCRLRRRPADRRLADPRGFAVTGVDFAEPMLDLCRARWPGGDWRHADMSVLELGETFDGIVGWDSFFHLHADPAAGLPAAPGQGTWRRAARLMLTVGPDATEAMGAVEGDPVYHASLSPAGYAAALEACGLRLRAFMAEDPECDFHSVLLARKVGG